MPCSVVNTRADRRSLLHRLGVALTCRRFGEPWAESTRAVLGSIDFPGKPKLLRCYRVSHHFEPPDFEFDTPAIVAGTKRIFNEKISNSASIRTIRHSALSRSPANAFLPLDNLCCRSAMTASASFAARNTGPRNRDGSWLDHFLCFAIGIRPTAGQHCTQRWCWKAVPDLSFEGDNLGEIQQRIKKAGLEVQYDPAEEPWSVRRFHVRDPLDASSTF